MPTIISERNNQSMEQLKRVKYDYKYPEGLDLKPGSKLHDFIIRQVLERAQQAHSVVSRRFGSWNEIDRVLNTYVSLDEEEKNLKKNDPRKPTSIVFPYSYAILETLVTYLMAAFLQEPVFRYEGVSPDDKVGAILLEKVIQKQVLKHKVALNLHTFFRDGLAYGASFAAPYWKVRHGTRYVRQTQGKFDMWNRLIGREPVLEEERGILFEGNALDNIDPYLVLPDPRVSISEIQDGEFFGWVEKTNVVSLLEDEQNDQNYFNCLYAKHLLTGESFISTENSQRDVSTTGEAELSESITTPVDVIHMYVNLIPSDWNLGDEEYPQKWVFSVAGDSVVVQAKPLQLNHGMYPVAAAAPDYDGYSILPLSRIESLYGLQHTVDWLFNCYDEETEVLTSYGWMSIAQASERNVGVANVDPNTLELWFEEPYEWFEYDYEGYMIGSKTNRHDFLVTPTHNMFGRYRYATEPVFKEAALLFSRRPSDEFKIPMSVFWESASKHEDCTFDAIQPKRDRGNELRYPERSISHDLMADFLGWFLSDGGITNGKSGGSYAVSLKQVKSEGIQAIDRIMAEMEFHVTIYDYDKQGSRQWTITDRRLYEWLEEFCYEGGTTGIYKKVPEFIKSSDTFTLSLFLESFIAGDGSVHPTHENLIKVGTESKRLADDLQEICLKLGYSCVIKDSTTNAGKDFWYLAINKNSPESTVSLRNCYKKWYKGKVYCFENSTNLTLVRRHGKPMVCGQSHVANVRKAINDMMVVDPYLINMEDLKSPEAGKLIRMRRPGWGRGVKDAVMQLGVTDVTRQNIEDTAYLVQWMNHVAGADESMMGAMRQGGPERLTAQEFQGTRSSAISRLERMAQVIGLQGLQDIGYMFASHAQQYMSEESYVEVTGEWEQTLRKEYGVKDEDSRMKVRPEELKIDYDVNVRDGSVPGSNMSRAWIDLFKIISETEGLPQKFDVTRIFKHIARGLGAKNVEDFQIKTMDDEMAQRQAESGNLVKMEEYQNEMGERRGG